MKHARLLGILFGLLLASAGGVFVLLNQGEGGSPAGGEIAKEVFVAGVSLKETAENDETNEQSAGTEAEEVSAVPQPTTQPVAKQATPAAPSPKPPPSPTPTPKPATEPQLEPEAEPEESPQPPPPPLPSPTPIVKQYEGCSAGQINVNSASKEELVKITQIGDARADQIIQLRQQEPFWSIDDLVRVSGVSSARVASMRAQGLACTADPSVVQEKLHRQEEQPEEVEDTAGSCVDINTASKSRLVEIAHIGDARADQIIELRQQEPFGSVDDLVRVSGISAGRVADINEQGLACVE